MAANKHVNIVVAILSITAIVAAASGNAGNSTTITSALPIHAFDQAAHGASNGAATFVSMALLLLTGTMIAAGGSNITRGTANKAGAR